MRKLIIIAAKSVLALISLACVGLLVFVGWFVWHYEYALGLPTKDRIAAVSPTGPACTTVPQRAYIPLAEIPPLLRKAIIASEQPDFYEAWSLNPFVELALALVRRRKPGPAGITQAVARCLLSLAPEPYNGESLDRHVGTIVLVKRVTSTLSRDRILEIYLNEAYLGRGSYGVGAASASYFGKPLGLLRTDEIAFIAALPRAPALLNRRQDIALDRRNHVIDRMLRAGVIGDAEAKSARERPVEFLDPPAATATEQRKP
jgi:membrane peptidoglycan carboxypeptidase